MAEKWILHSAERGYSSAQSLLGTEYASGARLRQDANAAIHWLALAAQNSTSAGVKLAEVYLEGKIVPRNLDESLKWLTYAADGGFGSRAMKLVAAKCFDGRFNAAEACTASKLRPTITE